MKKILACVMVIIMISCTSTSTVFATCKNTLQQKQVTNSDSCREYSEVVSFKNCAEKAKGFFTYIFSNGIFKFWQKDIKTDTEVTMPESESCCEENSKATENETKEQSTSSDVSEQKNNSDVNDDTETSNQSSNSTESKVESQLSNDAQTSSQDYANKEPQQNDNVETNFAQEVVSLVNKERTSRGLGELSVDLNVQAAAQIRAQEEKISFSHTRPNGTSCFTALKENGVSYRGAGENIAMGQKSAVQVMNGWMNSSGHRANILNSKFTKIGVGVYKDSAGTYYWSQMFIY